MDDKERKRFLKNLLFAAAVIFLYFLIINLDSLGGRIVSFVSLFSPLLIGILIALILNTPLRFIEKLFFFLKRKSKAKHKLPDKVLSFIAIVLSYCLMAVIVYAILAGIVPQLGESFKSIIAAIEAFYPKLLAYMEDLNLDTTRLEELLSQFDWQAFLKKLTDNAGTIFDTAISTVSGFFSLLVNIVSALIFSGYLLGNRGNLKRQGSKLLEAYLSPHKAERVSHVAKLTVSTFTNFFSGQCLEAVILGMIFFLFMTIFRFPYALPISVVIAVTAIIPYVGAFIGCIFGMLLIAMQSPMQALLFLVMFLVIQQLENHLIYPRVVGTSVGLPAMWTFAALLVGGALYGVIGMLIFIPLTSVLYTLLRENVHLRLKQREKAPSQAEEPSDPPPAA